jgi:hypothetical protein
VCACGDVSCARASCGSEVNAAWCARRYEGDDVDTRPQGHGTDVEVAPRCPVRGCAIPSPGNLHHLPKWWRLPGLGIALVCRQGDRKASECLNDERRPGGLRAACRTDTGPTWVDGIYGVARVLSQCKRQRAVSLFRFTGPGLERGRPGIPGTSSRQLDWCNLGWLIDNGWSYRSRILRGKSCLHRP